MPNASLRALALPTVALGPPPMPQFRDCHRLGTHDMEGLGTRNKLRVTHCCRAKVCGRSPD